MLPLQKLAALGAGLTLLIAAGACSRSESKKKGDETPKTVTLPEVATPDPTRKGTQVPPPEGVGTIPADAQRTASGLAYQDLGSSGTDTRTPKRNDTVMVLYTIWRQNGVTEFTTDKSKQPVPIPLPDAGPGWVEAMQLMKVGQKRLLWMTPQLAFGPRAAKVGTEVLTFQVELVDIEPAPPVPADVAAPPADATTTESGLAYKVLVKGDGTIRPRLHDSVAFRVTGWTSDGMMVLDNRRDPKPRESVLFREMDGWREGIQTMVIGEQKRFWVPESLAKGVREQVGTLVFDIELLAIDPRPAPPPPPKDVAAPPASATRTVLGVAYQVVKKGRGKVRPTEKDMAEIIYTAWTTDGNMFDSSVPTGKPAQVPVGRLVPGWRNALEQLVEGERARFWIPEEHGFKGRPGPQGMLVFDIELVAIHEPPKPPPTPADVAAPPADAKKTPEGVFYKVLKPGTGKVHPTASDTVTVHYAGWTTDGKMFDTSITGGRPSSFSLGGVIKGWTVGIPVMVVGEKTRFWIPEALAYRGGEPKGMLVFEVELLEIK
ncbi:MAG TPA: FKBP-type peptidyl-prolyl cis-trans isomerase [Kofleriaceae bacterium]|nr:FKBP-type peptidyl-prolyl cis-trans isomerase [Kofleriaceae bacterium]